MGKRFYNNLTTRRQLENYIAYIGDRRAAM